MPRLLGPVAAAAADHFGDRPALVLHGDHPAVLTYDVLHRAADRWADRLVAAGLGPGHVVAAVLPGGPAWVVAAVAVDRAGATWAPVSTALAPPERAALVEGVRPSLVLADPTLVDGLPLRVPVVGVEPWDAVDGPAPSRVRATAAGAVPPDTAMVCFTSGTSGRPRGAVFTASHQRAVRRIDLGPEGEDRFGGGGAMVASTHLAHVGMALKLPWYLQTGATLHVLPRWRADDVLDLVAAHRVATLGVVAPQLALMLRSPRFDELDLTCVTTVVAGGAPSPPALVEEARRRLGAGYSIRYSSTESGGVGLATGPEADDDEALHTVGRPRPGVEARVADAEDRPLPDGEVGELQLRSGAVMAGYAGDGPGGLDADATAAALTADGWLRTGDLAERLPSGCFRLAGRRSEMYLRGGYNVFPMEVESVLGRSPAVAQVAVVPRADPVMGEVGVAVVVPAHPDRPPTLEELRAFAAPHLARHKLPEAVQVVDRLPLTAAQKLDRRALAGTVTGDVAAGTDDTAREGP